MSNTTDIELDLTEDELYAIVWMYVDENFNGPSKEVYDEIIKDKEDIKEALFHATVNDIVIRSLKHFIKMENNNNNGE